MCAVWGEQVSGAGPKTITLEPIGRYQALDGAGEPYFDRGAVEIAAYDKDTKRAFVTFAELNELRVVNLSDPSAPFEEAVIPLPGHATSVDVHKGVLAVAIPQGDHETAPGLVQFYDAYGALLAQVSVGALPDMITFTPDGQMVLTADEGQPDNYDPGNIDPEGSVSIIDLRGGVDDLTQDDVVIAGFQAFNGAALDPSIRIFGPGATVAQDLEPEYITVSHNSRTAWVTLQENNAIAEVDLRQKKVTNLVGLGFKDHWLPGNGLDGNRDDDQALIENWPVFGMYMPDAIASFRSKGQTLLVTANEGDARDYDGINGPGTDEETVEIEDIVLDPTVFEDWLPENPGDPMGDWMCPVRCIQRRTDGIGRLKVTPFNGNTDGGTDFEELYALGGRSFSIWTTDGTLVFDSGDAFEQVTAAAHPDNFNASNTNNTLDNRSDDKGPEPEGVTIASLFGHTYAFILLERIGGVTVYDLRDPSAPELVQYINTRDFSKDPEDDTADVGDLGSEGVRVLSADDSPTGKPLLLVSNEISGSLRIFEIQKTE
jgi:hypothetical protein